jgi:hypothetical protein
MSEERRTSGFTPVYGRLVRLRSAVEDTIDRAVENQAKLDKQAVARGQMSQEDTFAAKLQQEVANFHARRNAEMGDGGGGTGTASEARAGILPNAAGTKIPPGGAPRLPSVNQGIPDRCGRSSALKGRLSGYTPAGTDLR